VEEKFCRFTVPAARLRAGWKAINVTAPEVTIRSIQEADAAAFLELCRRLDEETAFMMFEPGERQTTAEQQRQRIRGWLEAGRDVVLVADAGQELVGFVALQGGGFRRNRHSGYLVIGVRLAHHGRGLGRRLLEGMEEQARRLGYHRLELTVMTHNSRAVGLYRKLGFEIEGVRKDSLWVEDRYIDEYSMAKLLSEEQG
jgi:RimJ/RimL family protein N-acetyltransferase